MSTYTLTQKTDSIDQDTKYWWWKKTTIITWTKQNKITNAPASWKWSQWNWNLHIIMFCPSSILTCSALFLLLPTFSPGMYPILCLLASQINPELLPMHRVPKWWHHKNDFSEIMGFIQLFGTTYLKKVHTQNIVSLVH